MNKMESTGERSADQKEIDKWLKETRNYLEKNIGITDLTNIELFSLRKDIENILRENQRLEKNRITETGTETANFNQVSPIIEAARRFFIHYGINLGNFPWGKLNADDESWEYIKRAVNKAREESHLP